jgi:hypothetical protein
MRGVCMRLWRGCSWSSSLFSVFGSRFFGSCSARVMKREEIGLRMARMGTNGTGGVVAISWVSR